jgi:hypothetical protein
MDQDAVLLTYMEVGVAFAGFAALVTVIRRRDAMEPTPVLTRRLRAMVEDALLVVVFAVLALSIRAFGVREEVVWRICSGLLAVVWSAEMFFGASRGRRMDRAGIRWGSEPYRYFIYSVTVAPILGLSANALGAFPSFSGPVFLSGLGVLLFLSTLFFIRLVAAIVPEKPPSDGAA